MTRDGIIRGVQASIASRMDTHLRLHFGLPNALSLDRFRAKKLLSFQGVCRE